MSKDTDLNINNKRSKAKPNVIFLALILLGMTYFLGVRDYPFNIIGSTFNSIGMMINKRNIDQIEREKKRIPITLIGRELILVGSHGNVDEDSAVNLIFLLKSADQWVVVYEKAINSSNAKIIRNLFINTNILFKELTLKNNSDQLMQIRKDFQTESQIFSNDEKLSFNQLLDFKIAGLLRKCIKDELDGASKTLFGIDQKAQLSDYCLVQSLPIWKTSDFGIAIALLIIFLIVFYFFCRNLRLLFKSGKTDLTPDIFHEID